MTTVAGPGHRWRFWVGIILSVASLMWLVSATDWSELVMVLTHADYRLILLALGVNLATIPVRSLRWRSFFPARQRPPFVRLTAVMVIGQAVNMLVPARVGDLLRANLVGTARAAFVLGTLAIQTFLDLLMLAGLVLVLLLQVALPTWWRRPGQVVLVTTAVALAVILAVFASRRYLIRLLPALKRRWPQGWVRRGADMLEHFLGSFDMMERPAVVVWALCLSLLIWAGYGLVNYVLLAAMDLEPSWLAAFFVLVVLQLGIAIPSSPGRLGVYHYLCVRALEVFGVDSTVAISYALILHFISVILPIVLGAVLSGQMGIRLSHVSRKMES